jgi:hypothetical protein
MRGHALAGPTKRSLEQLEIDEAMVPWGDDKEWWALPRRYSAQRNSAIIFPICSDRLI